MNEVGSLDPVGTNPKVPLRFCQGYRDGPQTGKHMSSTYIHFFPNVRKVQINAKCY